MRQMPEVEDIFAITGNGSAEPWNHLCWVLPATRNAKATQHSADAIVNRIRGCCLGITGALVLRFLPPAVQGLGQFGGFAVRIARSGRTVWKNLANVTQELVRQGSARKDLTGLFSSFTANDPQFLVTIDREKAKSLHVPLQQITDTLGVYMGSAYVNDFDFNNRSYRVYVQADQRFRAQAKDSCSSMCVLTLGR